MIKLKVFNKKLMTEGKNKNERLKVVKVSSKAKPSSLQKDKQSLTVNTLADILVNKDLTEIEYEENGVRIYLSRTIPTHTLNKVHPEINPYLTNIVPTANPLVDSTSNSPLKTEEDYKDHPGTVKSPMVGMVYIAPEPGAEPFVKVGDNVHIGQTLLIIEAMKVLNPIKASKAGKVVAVLVYDQKPVEYDESLMVIA